MGPFDVMEQAGDNIVGLPMIRDQIISVARPQHPIFELDSDLEEALLSYSWVAPYGWVWECRVGAEFVALM